MSLGKTRIKMSMEDRLIRRTEKEIKHLNSRIDDFKGWILFYEMKIKIDKKFLEEIEDKKKA